MGQLYVFLSGCCNWIVLVLCSVACQGLCAPAAEYFTIPEAKLLTSDFAGTAWGGDAMRTDSVGDTVLLVFSGLSGSSTGLKDDYPADTVYGQILPSHGSGDFSNFGGYALWVRNLDAGPVSLSLFINTGFTGPSGNPSNNWRNDTFWQSEWTVFEPGEARTIWLDFEMAIPWNISDNPLPHTQGTDGTPMPVSAYDRTEVSAVGFQIHAQDNPEATILVAPAAWPMCTARPEGDLNNNCKVDFHDLAILALRWLDCNLMPASLCN